MMYQSRVLEKVFEHYLNIFPVLAITGPRQSGKTTMIKRILADKYSYVSFDDYQLVVFFQNDPVQFMRQYHDNVIFDEVQKVPGIFNYLKIAVDNDRERKGKFIITGSSQFSFIQGITETLAGRIGLLSLLPFQYKEIPFALRPEAVYRGCYPEVINDGYNHSFEWYSAYLETFVMRDVKSLIHIGDLHDFRQFMTLVASRCAQILNYSDLSRDIGVSVNTIRRWISVLEAAYILFILPPWYANIGKRLIKSPKVYFYDTGLVSVLTGITRFEHYNKGPMAGSLFENYIVSEIKKKSIHEGRNDPMYFFRTSHGEEIDLIIDRYPGKILIEIKKTATFRPTLVHQIEKFLKGDDTGYLLYEGEPFPYRDNLKVISYWNYLNE